MCLQKHQITKTKIVPYADADFMFNWQVTFPSKSFFFIRLHFIAQFYQFLSRYLYEVLSYE